MNQNKIRNLIKVWREKAFKERDPFSKFLFLWICFNAWLEHRSGKDADAKMIEWLVNQTNTSSDLVESFELCKNKPIFNNSLDILAQKSPFKDSRGKRPDITVKDKNDFENIVRAIYRIRCNLFHGSSEAQENRVREQIAISNAILNEWISTLLVKINKT
jgi:hypothetical protein